MTEPDRPDPLDPWRVTCPACHPRPVSADPLCVMCGGRGSVQVVLAPAEALRLGARAITDGWTPLRTKDALRARYPHGIDGVPKAWVALDLGWLVGAVEELEAQLGMAGLPDPVFRATTDDGAPVDQASAAIRDQIRTVTTSGRPVLQILQHGDDLAVHVVQRPTPAILRTLEQALATMRTYLTRDAPIAADAPPDSKVTH